MGVVLLIGALGVQSIGEGRSDWLLFAKVWVVLRESHMRRVLIVDVASIL